MREQIKGLKATYYYEFIDTNDLIKDENGIKYISLEQVGDDCKIFGYFDYDWILALHTLYECTKIGGSNTSYPSKNKPKNNNFEHEYVFSINTSRPSPISSFMEGKIWDIITNENVKAFTVEQFQTIVGPFPLP